MLTSNTGVPKVKGGQAFIPFFFHTDDAYVHGAVKVTILGDINRDGSVETTDLIMLGCSWDTDVEDPYNELLNTTFDRHCDFNDDIIETGDLIIL
jgi:hypothetical protein